MLVSVFFLKPLDPPGDPGGPGLDSAETETCSESLAEHNQKTVIRLVSRFTLFQVSFMDRCGTKSLLTSEMLKSVLQFRKLCRRAFGKYFVTSIKMI